MCNKIIKQEAVPTQEKQMGIHLAKIQYPSSFLELSLGGFEDHINAAAARNMATMQRPKIALTKHRTLKFDFG